MSEHDRWSAHLEYLKLAIALSTGVLSAAAAIYLDSGKIPNDITKYFLLVGVAAFFLALLFSILGVVFLSNLLIHAAPPSSGTGSGAGGGASGSGGSSGTRGRKITINAGLSFFFLCFAGSAMAALFGWKTLVDSRTGLERALTTSDALVKQQINPQMETTALSEIQVSGPDKYSVKYKVIPGASSLELVFDAKTNAIESFKRVP